MSNTHLVTEKHNLISETKFQFKSFLLIIRRKLQNSFSGIKKFSNGGKLKSLPVVSVSESYLWNADDNEQNWILTAGKIQNLRLAAKFLNGREIGANCLFSFWKQLGNPNIGRGYVVGREIREGCIVPTIAGGLCQLSNALYDAALKANFEIIERHRHTKVIKGSLAEQDRDATVKWNYIDLRFRSTNSFRIEVDITLDKLIVKFRSAKKNTAGGQGSTVLFQSSKLNDCYSCGNFTCFKNPEQISKRRDEAITTFVIDEKWPEFEYYIKGISTGKDTFVIPRVNKKLIGLLFKLRLKLGKNIFEEMLRRDKWMAKKVAKFIPVESTHLVISQNLLPFLLAEGVLGGRTFDVLMSRLPMEKLHKRLDVAKERYPESKTLDDFRASSELVNRENLALTKARHIITPHSEIAGIFNNKSVKLEWISPKTSSDKREKGNKILFPASGLARKGANEMKRLARELNLRIVLTGKAIESRGFWEEVLVEMAGGNPFEGVRAVVYPAYVEHQPRILLKAITLGIPVIATAACGLSPAANLTIIPVGDYDALKQAVSSL